MVERDKSLYNLRVMINLHYNYKSDVVFSKLLSGLQIIDEMEYQISVIILANYSQDYSLWINRISIFSDNVTRLNIYFLYKKDWTMIHKFPVRMAESKARKLHHHGSDDNVVLILI